MRKFLFIVSLATLLIGISAYMLLHTYKPETAAASTSAVVSELESNSLNTTISNWTTIQGGCNPGIEAARVVFYCNGSAREQLNPTLANAGQYQIVVHGASSNSSPAGIQIEIDGAVVGSLSFSGTTYTDASIRYIAPVVSAARRVRFVLTNDTGANDTIIDNYSVEYLGVAPTAVPLPTLPTVGAAVSGKYRNVFAEAGYSGTEITAKVNAAWTSLFYGDANNNAVYRSVGSDMAFIEDTGNNDIRSEGMSYGMMIAVQMNKKAEFDKLWKFAKTYMLCPRADQCVAGSGKDGYFSWQLSNTAPYRAMDEGSAPDGDEYFATALIFAGNRWGNTSGLNYHTDAQNILNALRNDARPNGMRSSFDPVTKLVVFAPIGNSAHDTDPSYHLPAFYEVWSRFDTTAAGKTFWQQAAVASRAYWQSIAAKTPGGTTGLLPDCTDFSGTPSNNCAGGSIFAYDSWRTIANIAVDQAWWLQDPWAVGHSTRYQAFFGSKRPSYQNRWNLDGTPVGGDFGSQGNVAMNGVAGLAAISNNTYPLIQDVWNLPIPTGRYRYYDGMLYLMSLLHLSGNFQAYMGAGSVQVPVYPTPTSIPSATPRPTSIPLSTATPVFFPSNTPAIIATKVPAATVTPSPTPTKVIPTPTTVSGSKTIQVSSLNWTGFSNGWGPVERNMSNGEQGQNDGKTISLRGKKYGTGLGTHAYSSVNYHIKGVCSTFASIIGVDDESGTGGSVIFQVYADGNRIYQSPILRGGGKIVSLNLPVLNRQYLELRVLDANDGIGNDHADWANARLQCSTSL